jgi:hypothetical protein
MLLHLGAPSWSVWPLRGTGAAVMGIAARPCHRGGAGTGRRPPAPGHPRVGLQPSPHGLGLLDGIVVGPHREPGLPCSRSAFLAGAEPVSAPPMGGPCPQAVVPRPGGRRAGAGQVMLRVLARRHARHRRPCGHPGTAHWGPQMASQVVRKHHRLLGRARRPHNPEAGQAGDPLGSIALSDRLGTLPPQPLSWRQRRRVSAATVISRLACSVRASVAPLQRVRHQPEARGGAVSRASSGRRRGGTSTVVRPGGGRRPWSSGSRARVPCREAHTARYTRARAESDHGNRRGGAPVGTQPPDMEGQQEAVACAPQRGPHPALFRRGHGDAGVLGQRGASALPGGVVPADGSESTLAVPMSCGLI